MSSIAAVLGKGFSNSPLKEAFLKWQCRVRQMSMRDLEGRPDDSIMPEVILAGETESMGAIITILNKAPSYSLTAEMKHMAAKTFDPAQRREAALKFFSAVYYQKHHEFSDILTATFPPKSPGAAKIRAADRCTLVFEAYNQRFDLDCKVWKLAPRNPLYQATFAHNRLFNPALTPESEILGFEPNWDASTSEPPIK